MGRPIVDSLVLTDIKRDQESQSDGEQQDFNDQRMLVSMSTTFYPRDDHPTDLIIISVDGVFFSVHRRRLLQQSQNAFGNHLFLDDCQSFTGTLNFLGIIDHSHDY